MSIYRYFTLLTFAALAHATPVSYTLNFSYTFGGETQQGATMPGGWQQPAGIPVPAPTASFYYDPTFPDDGEYLWAFSNTPDSTTGEFYVDWGGVQFNMTNGWLEGSPSCANGQTGDAGMFDVLTNCAGATYSWWGEIPNDYWGPFNISVDAPGGGGVLLSGQCYCYGTGPVELSGGTFSAVDPPTGGGTTTPEPGTWTALAGLGALTLRRVYALHAAVRPDAQGAWHSDAH